ncbi:MAG: ABC transporter substrate-binding protein [Lachnospirales bacterium]
MKNILKLTSIAVLTFVLGSCSSNTSVDTSTSTDTQDTTENTETENTAQTEETVGDTVTITDIRGEVEIPVNPQSMVDLSGSSDMLELLGYDIKGTANSDAYDYTKFPVYLEDTLEGATILGYSMVAEMDVEAIMALAPDLIVISTVQEGMYDQLSEIAPTVLIQLEGVDWKDDFMNVASTFQKEAEATTWLNEYDTKATTIGEDIKATYGEDTSYLSFLASGESLFLFADAGIGTLLYDDLGLALPEGMPEQENISLPVVTIEGLAEINSDYLICLATDTDKALLEANPIWNSLEPVKNGKVVYLPASPYFNQGYSPIGSELLLDEIGPWLEETK